MRVALLQVASPDAESVETRRSRVDALVRAEGALANTDLLILPELWGVGCFHFDSYASVAEPFDGPSLALARGWAAAHNLTVHVGSFVETDASDLFNTAAVVTPDGEVALKYRKVHLFGADEARVMTPGDAVAVAPMSTTALGAAICYDLRFPELFRSIVDAGATVTSIVAAWPDVRAEHWKLLAAARAIEDQMYVLACNAVGIQHGVQLAGGSRVVDPWGAVTAEAGNDEGFTYADIDLDLPERVRQGFPALADRRWTGA